MTHHEPLAIAIVNAVVSLARVVVTRIEGTHGS
jgi:hypothetical protein